MEGLFEVFIQAIYIFPSSPNCLFPSISDPPPLYPLFSPFPTTLVPPQIFKLVDRLGCSGTCSNHVLGCHRNHWKHPHPRAPTSSASSPSNGSFLSLGP